MFADKDILNFVDEANKFEAKKIDEYVNNLKKAATTIYKKYKKRLERIVALQQIDKQVKAIEFKIDTEFSCDVTMNMYSEFTVTARITPKSGEQVEEDILTAQWHGTGLGLNDEIVKYIQNAGNINKDDPKVKDASYYFQPSNMDTKFKNEYERAIKKV
jgi:aromatic ring-cleaving dioxygenase